MKKVFIANDHAGVELKKFLIEKLSSKFQFINLGTDTSDSVDYPDYANSLTQELDRKTADFGILICGSGIGISIAANRNKFVRAALVYNEETAKLARQHNNANVICLGARFLTPEQALNYVEIFLNTSFEGGRHQQRVDKLFN